MLTEISQPPSIGSGWPSASVGVTHIQLGKPQAPLRFSASQRDTPAASTENIQLLELPLRLFVPANEEWWDRVVQTHGAVPDSFMFSAAIFAFSVRFLLTPFRALFMFSSPQSNVHRESTMASVTLYRPAASVNFSQVTTAYKDVLSHPENYYQVSL